MGQIGGIRLHGYELRVHQDFHSELLPARDLLVALPPGYSADASRRFPVLYLHDGQNLFGDSASPMSGSGWQIDRSAAALVAAGEIEPLILVGIPNAGPQRADEYTPTKDEEGKRGGNASAYARMVVEEIKPFIDGEYRTLSGRDTTGIGGSSFGALVSLNLGLTFPQIFGKLALLSLSWGWSQEHVLSQIAAVHAKPDTTIWLDHGTAEGDHITQANRAIRDALVAKGWTPGSDLRYTEFEGAQHTEQAWAERAPLFLRFLFPSK